MQTVLFKPVNNIFVCLFVSFNFFFLLAPYQRLLLFYSVVSARANPHRLKKEAGKLENLGDGAKKLEERFKKNKINRNR